MISSLKSYFNKIINLAPLRRIKDFSLNLLDKCTGGRGLKIWAKPKLRLVKSHENFHEFVLENGLRVIAKQSKGKQLSASLHIKSGAMKDPKGKDGLAHLLEHLVCDKTQEFGDKVFKIAAINGGGFNASTSKTETKYMIGLPAEKLSLGLRILSAFMRKLKVTEDELKSEKNIIDKEMAMHKSNPAWQADNEENKILFGENSLLSKDLIGNKESLESITLSDLESFHNQEYCPNNAILELSGNFNISDLKRQLEEHFAGLPANPKHQEIKDLQINGSKELEHKRNWNLPEAAIAREHLVGILNKRERYIATLVNSALISKNSTRLYPKLINTADPVANNIKPITIANKYHSVIGYVATIPAAKYNTENVKKIKDIVDQEYKDIALNGLKAEEISEVITAKKHQQLAKADHQHSDISDVTDSFLMEEKDWETVVDPIKVLESISQDEIKAFVSKYLCSNQPYYIQFDPSGKKAEQIDQIESVRQAKQKAETTIEEFKTLKAISGGLITPYIELPPTETRTLNNGSNVLFLEDKDSHTFQALITFNDGFLSEASEDFYKFPILSELMSKLGIYHRKTDKHIDDIALAKIRKKHGFSLSEMVTDNNVLFNLRGMSKNTDLLMQYTSSYINENAILALDNPKIKAIAERELAKLKKKVISHLKAAQRYDNGAASRAFVNSIYPKTHTNYNLSIEEQIQIINSINLEDMQKLFTRFFKQNKKAKIHIRGNVDRDSVCTSLNKLLDGMQAPAKTDRAIIPERIATIQSPIRKGLQVINSKKPDKKDVTVTIGNPHDIKSTERDFDIARLVNAYIGGQAFSSKLLQKLRTEKELVYNVDSGFAATPTHTRPFEISLSCRPNQSKEAITTVISTIKESLAKGISPEELEYFKHQHLNSWHTALNSKNQIHTEITELDRRGKDLKYLENYPDYINSITVEDFNRVMRRLIKPEQMVCIVEKPAQAQNFNEELSLAA